MNNLCRLNKYLVWFHMTSCSWMDTWVLRFRRNMLPPSSGIKIKLLLFNGKDEDGIFIRHIGTYKLRYVICKVYHPRCALN